MSGDGMECDPFGTASLEGLAEGQDSAFVRDELIADIPGGPVGMGQLTLDANDDGILDTAVLTDGQTSVYGTDVNTDGVADIIVTTFEDTVTGTLVLDETGYESILFQESGGFQVPERWDDEFTHSEGPDASLFRMAVEAWPIAYPELPWPVDDLGEPYSPKVLLGIIADDQDLPTSISHPVDEALATYDRITSGLIDSLGAQQIWANGLDLAADTISGDPVESSNYWLYQGDVGSCAPTTVAMVLGGILGVELQSNHQVVERAELLLGMEVDSDDWNGLTMEQTMLLVESYGVDCSLSYGDTAALASYLEAGHAVMVSVDNDEVYEGDDDPRDGGVGADHMLQVTGVDVTNGVVYLNNPNDPTGPSVIPLDQFEKAWADSGNQMIVTELPSDEARALIPADVRLDLIQIRPGQDGPNEGDGTSEPPEPRETFAPDVEAPPEQPLDEVGRTEFDQRLLVLLPAIVITSAVMVTALRR